MWSPDDQILLALTLNEIHLIDVSTGQYSQLDIPQYEIRGVSFKSPAIIAFTVREGSSWRVYNYQIDDGTIIPEDPKWQYIQFRQNPEDTLWLDKNDLLYVGQEPIQIQSDLIPSKELLYGRKWNLRKINDTWYWFEHGQSFQIKSYEQGSEQSISLVETNVPFFDIKNHQLLYGAAKETSNNLYTTQVIEQN